MSGFKELKWALVSFGHFKYWNRTGDYSRQSYKQYKSSEDEKVN